MKFSDYQNNIFNEIENGSGSIMVDAVAGSGKTTTILHGLNKIPSSSDVIFMAFNKAIASELSRKVPQNVLACTYHSAGFRAWNSHTGRSRVKVDSRKVSNIIKKLAESKDITVSERYSYGAFVQKLVSHAKGAAVGIDDNKDHIGVWRGLVSHFGLMLADDLSVERGIAIARKVFTRSRRQKLIVDFDDMIYLPLYHKARFQKYDYIFVDEFQDTNAAQSAIISRMMKGKTRVIFVGDPRQAIYGFRGADADAAEKLAEKFDCKRLPLSVSYRCGKAIVKEAQRYVPEIEPFPGSIDGQVLDRPDFKNKDFKYGDAILCRNNAPLVKKAYALISQGVSVDFLGRDLGAGLKMLIKNLRKGNDIDKLEDSLISWREKEVARHIKQENEHLIQSVDDKFECINVFISNLSMSDYTVDALVRNIDNLFSNNGNAKVTLATVHASKGREWDRVFILDRFLMPSRWAKKEWQMAQEVNLQYVATTRAKKTLIYIYS